MQNNKLLEIALRALSHGWSVIPLKEDKRPLISWTPFQFRRADESEIRAWFEQFPDTLTAIGVVTGKISNLTVVDFEEGADFSLIQDKTFTVKTGGNGMHKYFQYDPDFRNSARTLPLIDIRSEGGYVVGFGSKSYKGEYTLLDDCLVAPMPKRVKDLLLNGKKKYSAPIDTPNPDMTQTPEQVASDSFFLLESYTGFGPGQRNDEMTRFIGKVLNRINPLFWDTFGFDVICKANEKNTPPLERFELYNSFKSIKGIRMRETPIENNPTHKVIGPISVEGDEVQHISTVAANQKLDSTEVFPTQMEIFDKALRGGFRLGNIVIVAAMTGHGKTSVVQDWTMSFTENVKKTGVLWFSYEVTVADLWSNFKEMGMNTENTAVIPAKHTSGNVLWVEEKIKEAKEKFGIKVAVIDHLGFLLPKTSGVLGKNMSLNQAAFVTQIVRDLKTIAINEEIIIILPVHVAKIKGRTNVDQEDIKDSSGIAQEADCVFLLEREKNKDSSIEEYYTENTKITLSKNRKYGSTPFGWFTMINRRFAFDKEKDFTLKQKEESKSPQSFIEKAKEKKQAEAELEELVEDFRKVDDVNDPAKF